MAARTFGITPATGTELTLADLRELVEDTSGLPGTAEVRGQVAPRDFMNPSGPPLREMTVVFERPRGATVQGAVDA